MAFEESSSGYYDLDGKQLEVGFARRKWGGGGPDAGRMAACGEFAHQVLVGFGVRDSRNCCFRVRWVRCVGVACRLAPLA